MNFAILIASSLFAATSHADTWTNQNGKDVTVLQAWIGESVGMGGYSGNEFDLADCVRTSLKSTIHLPRNVVAVRCDARGETDDRARRRRQWLCGWGGSMECVSLSLRGTTGVRCWPQTSLCVARM